MSENTKFFIVAIIVLMCIAAGIGKMLHLERLEKQDRFDHRERMAAHGYVQQVSFPEGCRGRPVLMWVKL
jgi:hypothetical protein